LISSLLSYFIVVDIPPKVKITVITFLCKRTMPKILPQVDYVVRAQWSNLYVVDVTATINCSHQQKRKDRFGVDGWNVEFVLQRSHRIRRHWNAAFHQDGDDVQGNKILVTHDKFSSPVRGKAIFYFGFEVEIDDGRKESPSIPVTMVINSQVCEVDAYFACELADCAFDYVAEDSRSPSPSPPCSRESSPSPPRRRCKSAPPVVQTTEFQFLPKSACEQTIPFSPSADRRFFLPASSEAASEASTPLDEGHQPSDAERTTSKQRHSSPSAVPADSGSPDASDHKTESVSQIESSSSSAESFLPSLLGKRKVPEADSSVPTDIVSDLQRESPVLITGAPRTLKLEYYRRSEQLKKRKYRHMDWIDATFKSREKLVLKTVLNDSSIILEPNMFPYDTPPGVSHWTLWSRNWLKDEDIERFVQGWLLRNMPEVVEWNFDDNMSDGLSINLFHVHVYMRCDVKS